MLRFRHKDFVVERRVTRAEFEAWIAPDLARLAATVDQVLAQADVPADAGGSRVPHRRHRVRPRRPPPVRNRFGAARLAGGGEFVSVAEGLALIGQPA